MNMAHELNQRVPNQAVQLNAQRQPRAATQGGQIFGA